jgi:hypothetical protein
MPVPPRLRIAVGFVDEVLTTVSVPVAAPATVGSNCTLIVTVWFGLNVIGKVPPEIVNPLPLTVTELTVTAAVPVEDRITDCVAAEFRFTSPKAMLVALMLSVGTPDPS